MTELKDNSISLIGTIASTQEKQTKDGQNMEVKLVVSSSQLDGVRDKLAAAALDMVGITITPRQTELNTDPDKPAEQDGPRDVTPADGQMNLIEGDAD